MIICFPSVLIAQEYISSDTLQLNEVEVYGKTVSFYPIIVIPTRTLDHEIIRDIGDFLRQGPNVSGIRKGGVGIDPVIRGFKYNQVTALLNGGVKIEGGCPNRMDPVVSHIESENIQKIEIIKGPYILKYGPVLGALINLDTKLPHPYTKPEIHGKVLYGFESNWNGQREHIELEGGNDKIFFIVSGGYKGYGSYTAGNDSLYNTSFRKLYGTAAIGVAINESHKVILNYAYDQGKNILYPALPMDERLDQTHVGSLNYTGRNIGKIWKSIEIQGYFSSVHHVMDNLNRSTAKTMQAVTTVNSQNSGGKITSILQDGVHEFLIGIDFEHVFKDGDKQMTMKMIMDGDTFISVKHANVWLNALFNNIGAFAEYKIPFKRFDFTAALRFNYNQATSGDTFRLVNDGIVYFDDLNSNYFNVSFSLGMKKQLAKWLYINAALGKGSRSPSLLERYIKLMPVQYDAYDYLGNPQLQPENNYQADVSFELFHPNLGSLSVSGFFSMVTNYIIGKVVPPSVIKPSTQGAPGVKQFSNINRVYLTGFEVSYQSPTAKKWGLMANIAATYGTDPEAVKYLVSGGQVIGQETIKNDPLPEIPPLEGSVKFSYKFFRGKLITNASVRLVSGQNRVSQSYGEQKTPGFVTAAASISYAPCRFVSFVAGVENIFDTPYYEHLNRRIVGSAERLYEPGRVFCFTLSFKI
ncbi:MAG: TonB-dependent receptor [Bacteroidales bacterium]|nr:TonB-dependent receptor [Bacteroidales bacterium]